MTRSAVVLASLAVVLQGQAAPPVKELQGSIRVVVMSAATGAPMENARVTVTGGANNSISTRSGPTDDEGRIEFPNMRAGRYTVFAEAVVGATRATKIIDLAAGENAALEFRVVTDASLSGRILDQNNDPLPGFAVFLVSREYALGRARYVYSSMTATNDLGEYRFANVRPGAEYLLRAVEQRSALESMSRVPGNGNLRRQVFAPTYYPGTIAASGAQPIRLRDNERRENVDLRIVRSPNYCIEAELPAGARFELLERSPVLTFGPLGGTTTVGAPIPGGVAGADGRIRVCDLYAGEYELAAYLAPASGDEPEAFTRVEVVIAGQDVRGLRVIPRPRVALSGEVTWEGTPPSPPVTPKLSITFNPAARRFGRVQTSVAMPGNFDLSLMSDEYSLTPGPLPAPAGAYVKDVTYGGKSILRVPFSPEQASNDRRLRVSLGTDGGTIEARAVDRDGGAAADVQVVVVPKSVTSEAELAEAMQFGQADAKGTWKTRTLAPGGYYVLATRFRIDRSIEAIARLFRERGRAVEVELAPRGAMQVTVQLLAE